MNDHHLTKFSMKRVLAVALAAIGLSATGVASAEWSAGAGVEGFRWKESTIPEVKESGLRYTLDLTWTQSKEPGFSAGYNLKFYNGNVDYNGATLFGNTPLSGSTHYRGLINEVRAYYRLFLRPDLGAAPRTDFVMALGWDRWERSFSGSFQNEDWDVVYLKLGADVNTSAKRGIFGGAGLKYPVWTQENANFTDIGGVNNPHLRPGKGLSLYGNIGYRANEHWDVIAYYDSYRFKDSNAVAVQLSAGGTLSAFQPKSNMDVFGMKVQYNF